MGYYQYARQVLHQHGGVYRYHSRVVAVVCRLGHPKICLVAGNPGAVLYARRRPVVYWYVENETIDLGRRQLTTNISPLSPGSCNFRN